MIIDVLRKAQKQVIKQSSEIEAFLVDGTFNGKYEKEIKEMVLEMDELVRRMAELESKLDAA
jgi:hypothetical protein